MKAPLTLGRPANWQDFESLCKKLWGEIWDAPEIQKNGRLGQEQYGVDIFAIPKGEDAYFGIQCKNKSEYVDHNQLTKKEILEEIENAKKFEPQLKKLYFATTAVNDSKIQEFVRKINLQHLQKGLFEVHLFAWEAIVELICEHKQTYDWYVKSMNYKTDQKVNVTFNDNELELLAEPQFNQKIEIHSPPLPYFMQPLSATFNTFRSNLRTKELNRSYIPVQLVIHNLGSEAIEDYKILLEFEGDIQDLSMTNTKIHSAINISGLIQQPYCSTRVVNENRTGQIIPRNNLLVGDDSFISEVFFLKPFPKIANIVIKWKMISKKFKANGDLLIKVNPKINPIYRQIIDDKASDIVTQKGIIEDGIEIHQL